jgi:hypothetical protein
MWRKAGVVWGLAWLVVACRAVTALPLDDVEQGPDSGGAAGQRSPEEDAAGNESIVANAGAVGAGGSAHVGWPAGAAAGVEASCEAEAVTLDDIHAGRVRDDVPVAVGPLVVSSQKFLVSEAKSGSCLWGAFAADPARAGAGSGLLLVSFGAKHEPGEGCRAGHDGLPDDLTRGDLVEARGWSDAFAPAACDGIAPAQQLRIESSCGLRRTGRIAPPEPQTIDAALADRIAQGNDPALLRSWGGALVRLESVSALVDPDDGDGVFPFGVVKLAETRLEVSSRLYYFDLGEGGPRASVKSPHYEFPTSFASVTGLVLLDYCRWVLAPRDRCADTPTGQACAGQAAGP